MSWGYFEWSACSLGGQPDTGSQSLRPGARVGVALTGSVRVADGVREELAVAEVVAGGVGERQGVLGWVGVRGGGIGGSVGVGTAGSEAQGRSGWKMATPEEPVLT